eukprot:gnl/TRDRNA2_/TRDRNA2_36965_c0_seq1.p1 gnl/TRDRNA2_/TRDRNA2_36965_c0~~gnl/TRDRNA2_/TRDRNA2_36965_c0_seq1.p1  ORF type:complete len:581 (-),score=134.28 gnl/TRDRNA2_/TRDRNA2_36965_c0_seq1:62-1804(-)
MTAVTWEALSRQATGCTNDYIRLAGHEFGARLWQKGGDADARDDEDALVLLQEGVPVMFWIKDKRHFERRVFKVDNRLSFFYIAEDLAQIKKTSSPREVQGPDPFLPFAVRIDQVCDVHSNNSAMRLCNLYKIEDKHLNEASAVVIQFGESMADNPKEDTIAVFMASPQQHLPKLIKETIKKAPELSAVQNRVLSLVQSHSAENNIDVSDGGSKIRVEGIMLANVKDIFEDDTDAFQIEISFKQGKSKYISVPADLAIDHTEAKANGYGKEFSLTAIDTARLSLVIKDTAFLRQWAASTIPTQFDHRLHHLILTQETTGAIIHRNKDFEQAAQLIEMAAADMVETDADEGESMNMLDHYGHASARASHRALKHLIELEATFHDLIQDGSAKGMWKIPHAVTLAGDVIHGEEHHAKIEDSEKHGEIILQRTDSMRAQKERHDEKVAKEEELAAKKAQAKAKADAEAGKDGKESADKNVAAGDGQGLQNGQKASEKNDKSKEAAKAPAPEDPQAVKTTPMPVAPPAGMAKPAPGGGVGGSNNSAAAEQDFDPRGLACSRSCTSTPGGSRGEACMGGQGCALQ